ncbi:MAG: dihydroneopterin aldolase [Bdellovibrionales bacterium]|nr:dihydroneopterin aldolase [Bdellovibrionales bacterium]
MNLFVNELRLLVKIGVTPEERAFPQVVIVSLDVLVTDESSSNSDSLADTVDYVACAQTLELMCRDQEWNLLEKLCSDAALVLIKEFPLIERIGIKAKKNVLAQAESVAVCLSRGRND